MLKSVIQDYPNCDISVHIVWVPMLGSDNEATARKISSMFDDPRVHQYWDANRLSGTAYMRDVFPKMFRDMTASIPDNHPMAARLKPMFKKRGDAQPEKAPLWDAAFFYDGKAQWGDRPPKPAEWIKQIAYYGGRSDGVTGMFWLDDFSKPPTDTDWGDELGKRMKKMAGRESDKVESLGKSLNSLKEHFNAARGTNRFVALLSPT